MSDASLPIPQEGIDALRLLAEKWPEASHNANAFDPLWKESLALASPDWAGYAASTMGFLEIASSQLVSSNIELKGAGEHAAYKTLMEKLEALLAEVSIDPAKKSPRDNWHILRRPAPRTPAERLQQLMEDKKDLDQTGRGRLRGMRDAMELRELARVAAAVLSDSFPGLEKLIASSVAQQRQIFGSSGEGARIQAQQSNQKLRGLERASFALVSIKERLDHEFSSSANKSLGDLDEALHQEDMMHARVEGVMSKISSAIASEQVGQVAKLQASQSMSVLPPAQSVVPAKLGLLGRMFNRDAAKLGVWAQSAKTLRRMASEPLRANNWSDVMLLLSDPGVGPMTAVGNSTLLQKALEGALWAPNRVEMSRFIMLLSASDGGHALLNHTPQATVERYCFSLLNEQISDPDDDDDGFWDEGADSPQPDAPALPLVALEMWNRARLPARRGLSASIRFAKSVEAAWPVPTSQVTFPAWASLVQEALSKNPGAGLFNVTETEENRAFLTRVMCLIPAEEGSGLVDALLQAELRSDVKAPSMTLKERVCSLSGEAAESLALRILLEKRKSPEWLELLGANPAPVKNLGNYYFNPYQEMSAQGESAVDKFKGPNVKALRSYRDMTIGRDMSQWPSELAKVAFSCGSLGLLHEILEARPDVSVGWDPEAGFERNPLALLMDMDAKEFFPVDKYGRKFKPKSPENSFQNKTATDPLRWCRNLASWKDASAIVVSKPGGEVGALSFPRSTPLMMAAKINSHQWLRALLDVGADQSVRDPLDKTAMHYWIATICATRREEGGGKHSKGTPNVALAVVSNMDKVGWWDLDECVSHGISQESILVSLIALEISQGQVSPDLVSKRHEAVGAFLKKSGAQAFMSAIVSVVATGKSLEDPGIKRMVDLARTVGLEPEETNLEDLASKLAEERSRNEQVRLQIAMEEKKKMQMMKEMEYEMYVERHKSLSRFIKKI